ncbi:MAG: hypothetical protein ACT4O1_04225 [Gemmatimonadota bacterium]
MEDQLDQAAFDAFLLAMRVMYVAFDMDEPATKFEKPFELLREITNGQLALSSPAELGTRFPALKDLVYDAASSVMEHDRETAARVLRGLNNIGSMGA